MRSTVSAVRTLGMALLACAVLVGGAVWSAPTVQAQAAVTQIRLSAAVNGTTLTIPLTSVSGIVVGWRIFVDEELMAVNAINTTAVTVTVQRGVGGTGSSAHLINAITYAGPPNYFVITDPVGACTASAQVSLPVINVIAGHVWYCTPSGQWAGVSLVQFGYSTRPRTTVADAAYTIKPTDEIVAVTTLTAPRSLTLPSALGLAGHVYIIKDESGSANSQTITIVGTIDGATNTTITTAYGFKKLYSSGANWFAW